MPGSDLHVQETIYRACLQCQGQQGTRRVHFGVSECTYSTYVYIHYNMYCTSTYVAGCRDLNPWRCDRSCAYCLPSSYYGIFIFDISCCRTLTQFFLRTFLTTFNINKYSTNTGTCSKDNAIPSVKDMLTQFLFLILNVPNSCCKGKIMRVMETVPGNQV